MKDIPHCDAVQLHNDSDPLFAWSELDAVPKDLLTTMTRVGMAMNAMASAPDLSDELQHRPDGLLKTHFSQWLLISTAATTFEAILVFGKSAADLRPLAEKAIRMRHGSPSQSAGEVLREPPSSPTA
jgi:hypothetical protein